MKALLQCNNLKGVIKAPPSKSYAHRYLIASFLSFKECEVSNVVLNDDISATLNCLKELGCEINYHNNIVKLTKKENFSNDSPILDCHESGSTFRFLIPLSLILFHKVTITGSKRLLERGLASYQKVFEDNNIKVIKNPDNYYIFGNFTQNVFNISGSESSQYITGLLFALPLLPYDSIINILPPITSKPYIDITLDVLKKFQINYEINHNHIKIKGNQRYLSCNNYVEGDYSNAAFLEAFNYLNSDITILDLKSDSVQGDKKYQDYFKMLATGFCEIDLIDNIDLGPILFAFASFFHGGLFKNTNRLALKESNRLLAMQEELVKFNVKMTIKDNEVLITSGNITKPKEIIKTHNDHRIAMALSLFSALFEIEMSDIEIVKKSYPNYFKDLESLGAKITYED